MNYLKLSLAVWIASLSACTTMAPNTTQTTATQSESLEFVYTNPLGIKTDLEKIPYKINGMVRTEGSDVLGIGGSTYALTRYGAWNSRSGQKDVFVIGHQPSQTINLADDQIYYGRALRPSKQSVYDNRLTFALNFNDHTFKAFSVSVPDQYTFGSGILMHGNISGVQFEGTVESGKDKGRFSGRFYGLNGTEMLGVARFPNSNLDFSFGGDRQ